MQDLHVHWTAIQGAAILNPIALKKAKTADNFGLSECNKVNKKTTAYNFGLSECNKVNKKQHFHIKILIK